MHDDDTWWRHYLPPPNLKVDETMKGKKMKLAFIPDKIISQWSGDGINATGGQIVSVNHDLAVKLLSVYPKYWEVVGDKNDPEIKQLIKDVGIAVKIRADELTKGKTDDEAKTDNEKSKGKDLTKAENKSAGGGK